MFVAANGKRAIKDAAALLYQRFVKKTGMEPRTGETARVFALRVRQASILPGTTVDAVTEAYLEARYGTGGEEAQRRLQQAVAAMA